MARLQTCPAERSQPFKAEGKNEITCYEKMVLNIQRTSFAYSYRKLCVLYFNAKQITHQRR